MSNTVFVICAVSLFRSAVYDVQKYQLSVMKNVFKEHFFVFEYMILKQDQCHQFAMSISRIWDIEIFIFLEETLFDFEIVVLFKVLCKVVLLNCTLDFMKCFDCLIFCVVPLRNVVNESSPTSTVLKPTSPFRK